MKTEKVELGGWFLPLLFIVLLVLKCTGYINWSWIWIFSPLWIQAAIIVVLLLIWLIVRML